MSVTLERAQEVLLAKIQEFVKTEDSDVNADDLTVERLGQVYEEASWGNFDESQGVTQVKQWGGEDEGSSYGYVVSFDVDGEVVFLQLTGHYDSWNGVDWDYGTTKLVKPVERTVVFYE